jgi:hypothetical protein
MGISQSVGKRFVVAEPSTELVGTAGKVILPYVTSASDVCRIPISIHPTYPSLPSKPTHYFNRESLQY